jgi:hypothetical protein
MSTLSSSNSYRCFRLTTAIYMYLDIYIQFVYLPWCACPHCHWATHMNVLGSLQPHTCIYTYVYNLCTYPGVYMCGSGCPLSADIGWSMRYGGISDVGRRRLEYQLLENLGVGWDYQLCKPSLYMGWLWSSCLDYRFSFWLILLTSYVTRLCVDSWCLTRYDSCPGSLY